MRLMIGLNCLPVHTTTVNTPTGAVADGCAFSGNLCGVSILRAGQAMETSLRSCARSARLGKILIQRVSCFGMDARRKLRAGRGDGSSQVVLCQGGYPSTGKRPGSQQLPSDIAKRHCFLLDPMVGDILLEEVELIDSSRRARVCWRRSGSCWTTAFPRSISSS